MAQQSMLANLRVKIFTSISEIDPVLWNDFNASVPFGSFYWYSFVEETMPESRHYYMLFLDGDHLVGRAVFELSSTEPLPIHSILARKSMQAFFHRWPLLICKTPLVGLAGTHFSERISASSYFQHVSGEALKLSKKLSASFLLFDFVDHDDTKINDWQPQFKSIQVSDPGTQMRLGSKSFDEYMGQSGKDARYHYRRICRKIQEIGVVIKRQRSISQVNDALKLIEYVARKYNSPVPAWVKQILLKGEIDTITAIWVTAWLGSDLVGCGLTLIDNGAQVNVALGLVPDVPYVYFGLLYESLKIAFEYNVKLIRLGSGAYDVKRHLGFELENNNHVMVASANPALQFLIDRMV